MRKLFFASRKQKYKFQMELFLDTLDVEEVEKYAKLGLIEGVTTNPTFQSRFGMEDDMDMIYKLREALGHDRKIHVEAIGKTTKDIVSNAERLAKIDANLVFKIPFSAIGLDACAQLKEKGMRVNLHLVESVNQAILASKVNPDYICMLIGRLDDIGYNGLKEVATIKQAYTNHGIETKIMVSSVRNPVHVMGSFIFGAQSITIPPFIMAQMFEHPITESGYKQFWEDYEGNKSVSERIINKDVIIRQNTSIGECLRIMVKEKASAVIAIDEQQKLVGIFTAGDLERVAIKEFKLDEPIDGYLTKTPVVIQDSALVREARETMLVKDIVQLVVMDGEKVKGLLELKNL